MERVRRAALSMKNPALILLTVLLLSYGVPKIVIGTGHQAQGLWQRATGRYQPSEDTSWDAIKQWAASKGQVLPEASKAQLARSKKTGTPLMQIQMQDMLEQAQQGAAKHAGNAKDAAADYMAAAAGKAGEYKNAAGSMAGEYVDAAKRRTLPAPTLSQRFWSVATWKPVEQIQAEAMYADMKNSASGAYASGQQRAGEAANYVMDSARDAANGVGDMAAGPKEGTFAKMKRWMTGRSRAETHYTAAKENAGDAGGHLSQAAQEVYEAAKAAAGATASGAHAAWHADPAQAAKDAADAARDTTKEYAEAAGSKYESAKDAASGYVEAGKEKAGEVYNSAAEAVGATTGHVHSGAALAAEKARHRAEEEAQKAKHTAQEKMHAATAEL